VYIYINTRLVDMMRGHTWFQQEVCYRVLRGIPTPQSDFKIAFRSGCKSKEEGSKTRYYEGASVRLNDTHVLICVCMYVCVYICMGQCMCVRVCFWVCKYVYLSHRAVIICPCDGKTQNLVVSS